MWIIKCGNMDVPSWLWILGLTHDYGILAQEPLLHPASYGRLTVGSTHRDPSCELIAVEQLRCNPTNVSVALRSFMWRIGCEWEHHLPSHCYGIAAVES